MMRFTIMFLMLLGVSTLLVAQQKNNSDSLLQIKPFNDQSQRYFDLDILEEDDIQRDEVEQPNWAGRMPTLHGSSQNMAPMPNMLISDDVHYTMKIKRYRLEQSKPLTVPLDTSRFSNPKILPFTPLEK